MSEIWVPLAALAIGVVLGLVVRFTGIRRSPEPSPSPPRDRLRDLLHAADDLEYGLNTVLNFGPLSTSELASVDLPAKLERVFAVGLLAPELVAELRSHTEKIALHPFPEQRELLSAVRADERPAPLSAVWLVIREAVGSGAAQHHAAAEARRCLDAVRSQLRDELAARAPEAALA